MLYASKVSVIATILRLLDKFDKDAVSPLGVKEGT